MTLWTLDTESRISSIGLYCMRPWLGTERGMNPAQLTPAKGWKCPLKGWSAGSFPIIFGDFGLPEFQWPAQNHKKSLPLTRGAVFLRCKKIHCFRLKKSCFAPSGEAACKHGLRWCANIPNIVKPEFEAPSPSTTILWGNNLFGTTTVGRTHV